MLEADSTLSGEEAIFPQGEVGEVLGKVLAGQGDGWASWGHGLGKEEENLSESGGGTVLTSNWKTFVPINFVRHVACLK